MLIEWLPVFVQVAHVSTLLNHVINEVRKMLLAKAVEVFTLLSYVINHLYQFSLEILNFCFYPSQSYDKLTPRGRETFRLLRFLPLSVI